jgi:small-conductance mechanosensitive channel
VVQELTNLVAIRWQDLASAVVVALAVLLGLRLSLNWTGAAMRRARVAPDTQILVRRSLSVGILLIGLLLVLGMLGISPAGILTVAGAVGIAFGLAIQDILKNFFSGVYLLLERPFRVGDRIKVKDQIGTVENIGVRTTLLRTDENVQVLVPNAIVFAEVVSNHTEASPAPAESIDGAAPTPPVHAPEGHGEIGEPAGQRGGGPRA